MTTFYVTDEAQLDSAIAAVNAGTVATIDIANKFTLTSDPTAIDGNAIINGNSHAIIGEVALSGLDSLDAYAKPARRGRRRMNTAAPASL